ncbi:ImmA/IrrE family metallo-endopeptidase [Rhodococcus opacus]|nr:ImmA/IrrE family metallo-endopeptidase [Rhodococcus opacus]
MSVDFLLGVDQPAAALAARAGDDVVFDSVAVAKSEARRYAQQRADLAFLGYPLPDPVFVTPRSSGLMYVQGADLGEHAEGYVRRSRRNVADRDLASVIEECFAVDVAVVSLPDQFDGLAWNDEFSKLIVVGTTSRPGRQRFTIAHELCHLLVEDDQQSLHVDTDVFGAHKSELTEIRANAFAAAFLMPADKLESAVGSGRATLEVLAELTCTLSVSPNALAHRLSNLRLVSAELTAQLGRLSAYQAARIAGRAGELGEWVEHSSATRVPQRLVRDAFLAYSNGDTTLRPYANLVGMDVETLREALESASDVSIPQ